MGQCQSIGCLNKVSDVTADQFPLGKVGFQRWAAALIVLLVMVLALNFNARLATIRQMRQEETRLKQAVAAEEARQAGLQSLRAYVMSDTYVEHWARVDARMIKPREVPVILIAPNTAQASPNPAAPISAPSTILDEWWALFFGETPAVP
jgi:cell division protein FtsB